MQVHLEVLIFACECVKGHLRVSTSANVCATVDECRE
jgi:hypothetical protein